MSESTAYSALASAARDQSFHEATFATPFVTRQGVYMLASIASLAEVKRVRWIVGLDGVITTPEALRAITNSSLTASPRGWKQPPGKSSFHAKIYFLHSRRPARIVLYIGSANATEGGLSDNIEAGVLLIGRGADASKLVRMIDLWMSELWSSRGCILLDERTIRRYELTYRRLGPSAKRVARVVGVTRKPFSQVSPTGSYAWIEVAVRGGSSNQIEICRDMATFFKGSRQVDRVTFELVDGATGIIYAQNAYRFRSANFGHRVEINTHLARSLNLKAASSRRDVVLFRKTRQRKRYVFELLPAKAPGTKKLIADGKRRGRVHKTIPGPGGRQYFL